MKYAQSTHREVKRWSIQSNSIFSCNFKLIFLYFYQQDMIIVLSQIPFVSVENSFLENTLFVENVMQKTVTNFMCIVATLNMILKTFYIHYLICLKNH